MRKIKSVSVFLVNEETGEQGRKYLYEERNEAGQTMLEEQFHPDGSLESRAKRKYDAQQNLVEESFYSEEGEPDSVHVYELSPSGKPARIISRYRDGTHAYQRFERNEAEASEWTIVEDEHHHIESKVFRRYDTEGRLLEEAQYEGEEKLQQRTLTSYNDAGRPISQQITYEDGYQSTHSYSYEYDDQGRVISVKIDNEKGEEMRYEEYMYDEHNNVVEWYVEDHQRRQVFIQKSVYDEKGKLLQQQRLNGQEQIELEFAYRYSENDLLVERETATVNGNTLECYEYEFF